MSRSCPSCGSALDAEATTCPVCGETLAIDETGATVAAASAEPALPETTLTRRPGATAVATGAAGPATCPSCGATNAAGAFFCSTCGTRLATATNGKGAKPGKGAPDGSASPKRSSFLDYLYVLLAAVAVAGIIVIFFTPEEHAGPPQTAEEQAGGGAGGGAGSAMPPGHPQVNQQTPTPTPEQQAQIAALEKQVKDDPDDYDAKLKLADVYYDLERHTEAIPLFKEYLAKHPENADARTDMAYSIANTGGLDEAIGELNQVLRDNPRHQNAAYNLATMYVAKRNRDSTLFWLRRVVEIDSTSRPGQLAAQILGEVSQAHSAGDSSATRQ